MLGFECNSNSNDKRLPKFSRSCHHAQTSLFGWLQQTKFQWSFKFKEKLCHIEYFLWCPVNWIDASDHEARGCALCLFRENHSVTHPPTPTPPPSLMPSLALGNGPRHWPRGRCTPLPSQQSAVSDWDHFWRMTFIRNVESSRRGCPACSPGIHWVAGPLAAASRGRGRGRGAPPRRRRRYCRRAQPARPAAGPAGGSTSRFARRRRPWAPAGPSARPLRPPPAPNRRSLRFSAYWSLWVNQQ